MDRTDALRIFVRIAELGSFTRAAESLGLPRATVSVALRELEDDLGARLLHRTTRRVELTEDGRACYERARDLLSDLEDLRALFRGTQQLTGRLRVDMPSGFARTYVFPRLHEFTDAHPALHLEVSATDRRVDLLREGMDCVLRVGRLQDSNLVAIPLGDARMVTCASPAYLARHGIPRSPRELEGHRLVQYSPTFSGRPEGLEYFDGQAYRSVPLPGSVTVNNTDAYEAACLAGYGMIQVPVLGVQEHLAAGTLVEVLAEWPAEPMPVSLLYVHRRHLPMRVRAFMDWLAAIVRPLLEPRAPQSTMA